jgi:hypothetical protein
MLRKGPRESYLPVRMTHLMHLRSVRLRPLTKLTLGNCR